jgi:acyl carrier protein
MENVEATVIRIVAQYLDINESEIDTARPLNEAGVDSLGMLEIINGVEDEFGVRFDDTTLDHIKSLGDVVRAVQALCPQERAA